MRISYNMRISVWEYPEVDVVCSIEKVKYFDLCMQVEQTYTPENPEHLSN